MATPMPASVHDDEPHLMIGYTCARAWTLLVSIVLIRALNNQTPHTLKKAVYTQNAMYSCNF